MRAVIVCGSRAPSFASIRDMPKILADYNPAILIHGGASGVDSTAKHSADRLGIRTIEYKANWSKYGSAAGPIRNSEMLAKLKTYGTDIAVIAFPGGTGTKSMTELALAAGVAVVQVAVDGSTQVLRSGDPKEVP